MASRTRETILHHALHLFSAEGYSAVALDDIARAAGSRKSLVVYHFEDKAGLFRECIGEVVKRYRTLLNATLDKRDGAIIRLRKNFAANLALAEKYPGSLRLMTLFYATSGNDEVSRTLYREIVSATRSKYEELLLQGVREGAVSPAINAARTAATLYDWIVGAMISFSLHSETGDGVRETLARWDDLIAELCSGGTTSVETSVEKRSTRDARPEPFYVSPSTGNASISDSKRRSGKAPRKSPR